MNEGTVHSTHGDVTIDLDTGRVVRYDPCHLSEAADRATIASITRFDLAEYRRFWAGHRAVLATDPANDADFDILDLGYWYGPGDDYEPPEPDFRAGTVTTLAEGAGLAV